MEEAVDKLEIVEIKGPVRLSKLEQRNEED